MHSANLDLLDDHTSPLFTHFFSPAFIFIQFENSSFSLFGFVRALNRSSSFANWHLNKRDITKNGPAIIIRYKKSSHTTHNKLEPVKFVLVYRWKFSFLCYCWMVVRGQWPVFVCWGYKNAPYYTRIHSRFPLKSISEHPFTSIKITQKNWSTTILFTEKLLVKTFMQFILCVCVLCTDISFISLFLLFGPLLKFIGKIVSFV